MKFNSTVLILPGLGNSGEGHWQSRWEQQHPEFVRVQQKSWEAANCIDWIDELQKRIAQINTPEIILVAHSAACTMTAHWATQYVPVIKGALLVAPADSEAKSFPAGTSGFSPMPMNKLPFPSIVIASENDVYVTVERARSFAQAWGSDFVNIGKAGHINPASGFGEWEQGLQYLKKLEMK